jgi:2-amino-4-hydroxy-6-hydroxymethyldihydropteridine diphosphokinase
MTHCFIGLGSNLDNPAQQIEAAVAALKSVPQTRFTALSPLYRSIAIGPGPQPDYINAVVELFTTLPAAALLHELQTIETQQGRIRTVRWGARTLDLDLLLYGNNTINSTELTIPHPRMTIRNFVLYPLYDLAPELILPDGTALAVLLDCCPDTDLQRL